MNLTRSNPPDAASPAAGGPALKWLITLTALFGFGLAAAGIIEGVGTDIPGTQIANHPAAQ